MTTRPFGLRLLLPLVVAAALATSCSSGDDSTAAPAADASAPAAAPSSTATAEPSAPAAAPSSAPDAAQPATITIQDFEYDVPADVPAGAQITVMNEDREAHTVTLKDGPSVVVQGGSSAMMIAPANAGTYEVVCDFHGSMMAELVVA